MHFPWPYAYTTPPPLPTTQPQPTWPQPQPPTAPTFPLPQPSAFPHPQPQPYPAPPTMPIPAPTAQSYGPPSTWTFVQPSQPPPQPTQPPPVFPSAARPPSYMVPQLHPTPPAEPHPTAQIHPLSAPLQTTIAHHPVNDPQSTMPQGVWQPYSAFPPVTQPPSQPLPTPTPPLAIGDPPPAQPTPSNPMTQIQNTTTSGKDPTAPTQHITTSTTGSPSSASAPPACAPSIPATEQLGSAASPAPPPPSPHPHHSSRRHHHKSRRKSDHHHRGRRHHRSRHRHHRHSKHHSTSRRRRSPSTSTYSYSPTPSRSRSPQSIVLRPNTDNPNTDPSHYPTTAVLRRPINRWRPPPNFPALSPTDQLLEWFEFHANQLDTPNRPQHQYIANLLTDCNITYKDITDFRQYTHNKWNDTTRQYDQFQYNAISLPFLNTQATTPEPPAVSRATSTHREVAHINAGHTGPVGNIANILRQGRFLPSTLHFANYPGFFAQGVRITHNQPHDQSEFARIIHNTWQLHKNSHSIIITLLAWGAATKYTSGGEEHAMTLLNEHHGAVFHQKGRCWVIHPDHAIVEGLAWSTNSTPPDM